MFTFKQNQNQRKSDNLFPLDLFLPLLQPYNSSLIEIWPCQVLGYSFTKRARIGDRKRLITTICLSEFPWKTC